MHYTFNYFSLKPFHDCLVHQLLDREHPSVELQLLHGWQIEEDIASPYSYINLDGNGSFP